MRSSPIITWTCDRCGITFDCKGADQPPGWVGLDFSKPPLDEPRLRFHLCVDCLDALVAWWRDTPNKAPSPIA